MIIYEQALKTSPDNGVLLNNLAMLYLDAGDGRAVRQRRKSLQTAARTILPSPTRTVGHC